MWYGWLRGKGTWVDHVLQVVGLLLALYMAWYFAMRVNTHWLLQHLPFQKPAITVVAPLNPHGQVRHPAAPEAVAMRVVRDILTWKGQDRYQERVREALHHNWITQGFYYNALGSKNLQMQRYEVQRGLVHSWIRHERVYQFQSLSLTSCYVWISFDYYGTNRNGHKGTDTVYAREYVVRTTYGRTGKHYWAVDSGNTSTRRPS